MLGALDLTRPEDYRRFLAVNARALPGVEAALDGAARALDIDWKERRRGDALRTDCEGLGVQMAAAPRLDLSIDEGSVLGALYVLEGSRLGGAVLAARAGQSGDPDILTNTRFLRHGAGSRLWPRLLPRLAELEGDARARAVQAALVVFAHFEDAARHEGLVDASLATPPPASPSARADASGAARPSGPSPHAAANDTDAS